MARVIGKALIAFAVIPALLIIAAFVITLREPNSAALPMPNPNGYDGLVSAAQLVAEVSHRGTAQPVVEPLAERVARNTEALRLARAALTRECRVHFEDYSRHIIGLSTARSPMQFLARAFRYEGNLAEGENRPADAAQSYLANTRVGQEMTRGGAVVDALVGASIEEIGLTKLGEVVGSLNTDQCKQVIVALDSADAKRETVDNIVHQEKIVRRRMYGWRYYTHPIVNAQARHRVGCITVESDRTRKLMITLAARAFELEHGAKPKSINDLVPGYLKTIPKDAFTGKEMAYTP